MPEAFPDALTPVSHEAQSGAAEVPRRGSDVVRPRGRPGSWRPGRFLKFALLAALIIGIASPFFFKRRRKSNTWSADQAPPITATVAAGPFVQEVIERGEIESSSNVEARCEVQGRVSLGTAIIQIVPEGTYVGKGDFLVKLDDSSLQADLVQQQIACNTSRALVVEGTADVESARLALKEYESGTFLQEQQALESEEFVAKENLRRAEEYLRFSERLASRGYVTEVQLEADRFSVEKSRKELASARTKLEVLHKLTKQKTLNTLKANSEIAEARLRSRENSHTLDNDKLALIRAQIEKCVIHAPTAGQVVYANDPRNTTGEPLIAEGKLVRERQVIIRLPDPMRMQVTARINESRIDRVKAGMEVRVKVDAFPSAEMQGTVRDVSEYPLPSLIPYSMMKEYATVIEVHDPLEGLRPGMTAQVAIQVGKLDNALQVPLQAIIQRDNRFFSLVKDDADGLDAREVTVGLSNDKSVVIENGLSAGQTVVLAPQNYEDFVSLPAATGKPKPKPKSRPKAVNLSKATASAKQERKETKVPAALPALATP